MAIKHKIFQIGAAIVLATVMFTFVLPALTIFFQDQYQVPPPELQPSSYSRNPLYSRMETCPPNSQRSILLLTYGRCGSSLATDIISAHPDVFMYYEPLSNLATFFSRQQQEFMEATKRHLHLTRIPEYNDVAAQLLMKQMTCNYTALNRSVTYKPHIVRFNALMPLSYCFDRAKTDQARDTCILQAQRSCLKKPVKFVKTIRMSVRTASTIIDVNPCSKMIYLIRDPRASFLSKMKTFHFKAENVTFEAERFCSRLLRDVNDVIRLKIKYPSRVLLSRYETIATDIVRSSKQIYDFSGLDFTEEIASFLYRKAHSKAKNADRPFSTERSNAREATYQWRKSIPFKLSAAFDKFCSKSYSMLGYLQAQTEHDLRNLNKTLYVQSDMFEEFEME